MSNGHNKRSFYLYIIYELLCIFYRTITVLKKNHLHLIMLLIMVINRILSVISFILLKKHKTVTSLWP